MERIIDDLLKSFNFKSAIVKNTHITITADYRNYVIIVNTDKVKMTYDRIDDTLDIVAIDKYTPEAKELLTHLRSYRNAIRDKLKSYMLSKFVYNVITVRENESGCEYSHEVSIIGTFTSFKDAYNIRKKILHLGHFNEVVIKSNMVNFVDTIYSDYIVQTKRLYIDIESSCYYGSNSAL